MNSEIYNKSRTALIVVDIQKPFYSGSDGVRTSFPNLPEKVAELLKFARSNGYFIVHAHQESLSATSVWLPAWYRKNGREWSCEIRNDCTEEFAMETALEPVIQKSCFSAFHKTPLDDLLRKNNIKSVLVCGLLTSICVNYTAIGAYMNGFDVGLITDCCGDLSVDRHEQFQKLNECLYDMHTLNEFKGDIETELNTPS